MKIDIVADVRFCNVLISYLELSNELLDCKVYERIDRTLAKKKH